MNRLLSIVSFAVFVALAPSLTYAATITFDGSESNAWEDPDNWDLGRIPVDGDDVIIPTGKRCIISTADGDADTVSVASGATLGIEGRNLHVDETLTANGIVYLKQTRALKARIAFDSSTASLTGSGTVTAAAPSYGSGEITNSATLPSWDIAIGEDVTVKGSVWMLAAFTNNGTLLVDHADDTMTTVGALRIEGSGTFKVTAGKMTIDPGSGDFDAAAALQVSGGELEVTNAGYGSSRTSGAVSVSGGTLHLDWDFTATGGFKFTGGTIKVSENKTATFDDSGV